MTYRKLHRWHQSFGIIAALFVILLVVTGIALNHTERLALDQRFISSSLLLDWYNIKAPDQIVSYATGDHQVSLMGDRLYFNDQELDDRADQLLGALKHNDTIVIAVPGEILLLDHQGQMIEKLTGSEGVPSGMKRIGLSPDNSLIVEGAHGDYLADIRALSWEERSVPDTLWSQPSPISESLKTKLINAYRGKGLSLERVLLDLHSGRIFGSMGIYLIDAAGLLFLILAITGVWMWSRR